MKIVAYPHPALRYESKPVTRIDDTLRRQVREMFALMYESRGIGLAANQVALPFRFFVLNLTADPDAKQEERVFINPEILKRHSRTEGEEGCLSFPGLYAQVPRAKRVRVRAFDLEGQEFTVDAEDLFSRAVQHEMDHLCGRLFIDYLSPADLAKLAPKIQEFEIQHRQAQQSGLLEADEELARHLDALARGEAIVSDQAAPATSTAE